MDVQSLVGQSRDAVDAAVQGAGWSPVVGSFNLTSPAPATPTGWGYTLYWSGASGPPLLLVVRYTFGGAAGYTASSVTLVP